MRPTNKYAITPSWIGFHKTSDQFPVEAAII
jgi:hypothetical protein